MKKVLSVSLMALTFATAAEAGKTYVGASVGWLKTRQDGTSSVYQAGTPRYSRKFGFSDSAVTGCLLVGQSFDWNSHSLFMEAYGGLDNANTKKEVDLTASTLITKVDREFKRLGTLSFGGGIAKHFKPVTIYIKASFLLSKFETKIKDKTPGSNFSGKSTQYAWGFAPEVGVEKKFSSMSLGLSYSYQMYENVKSSINDSAGNLEHGFQMKPRYHTFMLTAKKSF